MQYREYKLTLHSKAHYGRKAPSDAMGAMLALTPEAVRSSIRMRFEGASSTRGRRASWLDAATDIRFVDHYGEDRTVLVFEAPILGEAAEEFYQQSDMFTELPLPTDTGFDLLGDLLVDVSRENAESNLYDPQLLKQVTQFEKGMNGVFQRADLSGNRYPENTPVLLDHGVINKARQLRSDTPSARRIRISGLLDMIRASTMGFGLKLANGQEVRGIFQDGDNTMLQKYYNTEVVILGKAIYRPSGGILRIDADHIQPATPADKFFSELPRAARKKFDLMETIRAQKHKKGLSAIIGKWPGEETDEEVERALQEIS